MYEVINMTEERKWTLLDFKAFKTTLPLAVYFLLNQ